MFRNLSLIFIAALLIACSDYKSSISDAELTAIFVFEIEPLFENKCMACHGSDPEAIEGGFRLTTRENLLRGGESGKAAIDLDDPEDSNILAAVKRLDPDLAMPPKDSEKLTSEEIQLLASWIKGGAPWPNDIEKEEILNDPQWKGKGKVVVKTKGALAESWSNRTYKLEDLWAYRPIVAEPVPDDRHPVDYFLDRRLDAVNLEPSPRANKSLLVRRTYLDLAGLPPTYEQLKDFSQGDDPLAYDKLVDHLLEESSYGEQMAKLWLDVVRYADSDGFSNDYVRPNAWRYRDYVIRSFNDDKPYNQFLLEQIAGDEMNPEDPEMLIAVGFLRMGPWEHTAMSVAKETRQLFLDDVVNGVGETFLSTPLMCAKCHDHKFDPIPTKDYYQMQAVFATTQFADRPASFLPEENQVMMEEEQNRINDWILETKTEQERIVRKEESAAAQWYAKRNQPYQTKKQRRALPDDQQPPRYLGLTYADLGYRKVLGKRMQSLQSISRRFEPLAYSVYNGPDRTIQSGREIRIPDDQSPSLASTFLLQGGSVFAPGEEVNPGVLQAVSLVHAIDLESTSNDLLSEITPEKDGRRLALAKWLVHPDHPITARSIANRIWQFHFGVGLAEDANNFGVSSDHPSHPELLDWIADYLVQNHWSIKKLHKLIMTSEAYQRSSQPADIPRLETVDPKNRLLSYFNPRRLSAEEIRDGMLFISGELNPEVGGIPVHPEINEEVALQPRHIMGSISQAYQPSRTPMERNRRTIYTERIRSLQNPFLSVFNQPGTDISCGRRSISTIAPQVLALFNGDQVRSRALALANDLVHSQELGTDQITAAFQRVWLRMPTDQELMMAMDYIDKMKVYHTENAIPKKSRPVTVKREMFEEMTGEPFSYEEKLDIYENYVADLDYINVDPATRSLADFCLVLFNSNEYMYVY